MKKKGIIIGALAAAAGVFAYKNKDKIKWKASEVKEKVKAKKCSKKAK